MYGGTTDGRNGGSAPSSPSRPGRSGSPRRTGTTRPTTMVLDADVVVEPLTDDTLSESIRNVLSGRDEQRASSRGTREVARQAVCASALDRPYGGIVSPRHRPAKEAKIAWAEAAGAGRPLQLRCGGTERPSGVLGWPCDYAHSKHNDADKIAPPATSRRGIIHGMRVAATAEVVNFGGAPLATTDLVVASLYLLPKQSPALNVLYFLFLVLSLALLAGLVKTGASSKCSKAHAF